MLFGLLIDVQIMMLPLSWTRAKFCDPGDTFCRHSFYAIRGGEVLKLLGMIYSVEVRENFCLKYIYSY